MGYNDAATPRDSVTDANLGHGEQIAINSSSQGPNYVSMERRVTSGKEASAIPSSTIKWLAREPESELSKSRANAPTSKSRALPQTKPRRPLKSNRQSLALSQSSVNKPLNKVEHRAPNRDIAVTRRQKDSRVVSILKKTGSILSWPFKL
jgi:hypothetical protein